MNGSGLLQTTRTIVVVGIGSPLLRDGAVGCHAVARAEKRLGGNRSAVFRQLPAGGFDLLYELEGYAGAVIVAGWYSAALSPGEITETVIDRGFNDTGNRLQLPGEHGIDVFSVLTLGRQCGYTMPDPVIILGVCGKDLYTLDEQPTPEVASAVERVVEIIEQRLTLWAT